MMKSKKKKYAAIFIVVVLLITIFSATHFFSDKEENNLIVHPEYSVSLNTENQFQCIHVKNVLANFEEGNITSIDVKLGLLPGSVPLNINDLKIYFTYIDREGNNQFEDYIFNSSYYEFLVKEMNIIDIEDRDNKWESRIITQNTTITLRFDGNFNPSMKGSIRFFLPLNRVIHIDIIMPPFITSPPLYSKYWGMTLINKTGLIDYPKPALEDWIVENTTVIENQEILLDKNMIVLKGAKLLFENVTIKVNESSQKSYGIFVSEGGELKANNSSISSINTSNVKNEWWFPRYEINVFGNISLNNCNLSYSEGLNIYGGLAEFENCSFYKNSLICSYTNMTLSTNKFYSCQRISFAYGFHILENNIFDSTPVYGWGEDLMVTKNIFCNSGSGLRSSFKKSHIINNKFLYLEFGIQVKGLSYILNNEINQNTGVSILIDGPCLLKNNSLIDTGDISMISYLFRESPYVFRAIIENNLLKNVSGGIWFNNNNIYMNNNEIKGSGSANLHCQGSSIVIVNSKINSELDWGLTARESSLFIINSSIDGYYGSLELDNSSAMIINSTIFYHGKGKYENWEGEMRDIVQFSLEKDSSIKIKNTDFDEDEVFFDDYKSKLVQPHKTMQKEKPPLSWRFYANSIHVITAIAIISVLTWVYMRRKKDKSKDR